jgi:hypothetical protein
MPLPRPLRLSLLAIGLAAAGAATSSEGARTTYDLSVSGVHVGTVTLRAEQHEGRYVAASEIKPSALVSVMTSYAYDGSASGTVDPDGKVTPLRFTADSSSPRAKRRTEIEWRDDGAPIRVSVEPPRRRPADPARVVGALDPVSAGFALLRDSPPDRICATSVEVFDGSRRSRLSLAEPRPAEGGGYACDGLYARLEGEAHSLSAASEYPFRLVFSPKGEGMVQLERIEARTRFGPAVVARRG